MKGYKDVLTRKADEDMEEESSEYPAVMICVSSEDLPEIKNWKIGATYTLKFKMISREVRESIKGKGSVHADLALVGESNKK